MTVTTARPTRGQTEATKVHRTNTDLPHPPSAERPAWARVDAPSRDPAQRTLFHDETERADELWKWLAISRGLCAERARKGYTFLSELSYKPEPEDVELYKHLLRWVAWCDSAYWLLTKWYGDDICEEPCQSLIVPFNDFPTADYLPLRVVRELHGLADEILMEDAIEIWRAASIRSGYLVPVGMPTVDGSTPEGGEE